MRQSVGHMRGVVVGVALLAGSALAAAPKLASPGFSAVNVDRDTTQFLSDHFAQQLRLAGPTVVTASEIGVILGLERQKQLSGCADASSSCMAELANALGVEGIIVGSVGKFEDLYQLNINVIGASDGKTLASFSTSASSTKTLVQDLTKGAETVGKTLMSQKRVPPQAGVVREAPSEPIRRRTWALVPAVVGVGSLAASGYFLSQAGSAHTQLTSPTTTLPYAQVDPTVKQGTQAQTVGLVLLGVGVLAVGGAAALWLTDTDVPAVTPTVSIDEHGGTIAIAGAFP